MRLGFIGTGTISSAVIHAFCADNALRQKLGVEHIFVSPRNAHIAAELAERFPCVTIARDNQQVADESDLIFVALPGRICEAALRKLKFKSNHKLVSFVPAATCAMLKEWTGNAVAIARAVPLPFVAEHKTVTPIFPADKDLEKLFGAAGGFIVAEGEAQFNLFMTAGSLMGVYYQFCGECCDWLAANGLSDAQAEQYMAPLFAALAEKANQSGAKGDFAALQQEYSTKGGTNELIAKRFEGKGGTEALASAISEAFSHISGK